MAILLAMASDDIDTTLRRFSSSPTGRDAAASPGSAPSTASAAGADANAVFLPEWFVPTEKDVVCGWARQNHKHPGNRRFRQLVEHSAPLYASATSKLGKSHVIAAVVEKVRRDSIGGGFVKKDFQSGRWFEIGDDKARDKVGHAIRRVLEELGKSSGLSKSAPAKKNNSLKKRPRKAGKTGKKKRGGDDESDDEDLMLDSIYNFFASPSSGLQPSDEKAALPIGPPLPASNLQQQTQPDGVIVPSVFFQRQQVGLGEGSGAPVQLGIPFQNTMGNASLVHQSAFAPSSDSTLFQLEQQQLLQQQMQQQMQQQFHNNEASRLNVLGHTSRPGLEGWDPNLEQLQANATNNGIFHLPQNNQFLLHSKQDPNNTSQQATFSALMEEQQHMNNQFLMHQNRRPSLAAGEPGLGTANLFNQSHLAAMGPTSLLPFSLANPTGLRATSAATLNAGVPSYLLQVPPHFGMSANPDGIGSLPNTTGITGNLALRQHMGQHMDGSGSNNNNFSNDPNQHTFP
ncbi:MAG: hypothetical protein SGILL_009028 [Bacillariaceae sp.]